MKSDLTTYISLCDRLPEFVICIVDSLDLCAKFERIFSTDRESCLSSAFFGLISENRTERIPLSSSRSTGPYSLL